MNNKSNIIFVVIIISSLIAAKYFVSKTVQIEKLNPVSLEKPKANDKSLVEIYEFHKNRKKTSNIINSGADSDKSECSMVRKVSEYVTTKFAGYILEYPCTAGSKGTIKTELSDNGEIVNQEYTLYLGIQLSDQKDSIWNDRLSNSREGKEGFLIILKSNGKPKSSPLFENFDQYTHVKTDELAGLEIYHKVSDRQSVIALLKNFEDASGNPPSVFCYLDAVDEISDVFSDLYNMSYKYASCNAHWMMTEDISLNVHSFKAEYAYKFQEFYELVAPQIIKIIKQKPT